MLRLLGIVLALALLFAWNVMPRLVEFNHLYPGQRLMAGQEPMVPQIMHVVRVGEHLGTIANWY